MHLLDSMTQFLRNEGYNAALGFMPHAPDRAVALYGADVREPGDPSGTGVLIHVRGERHSDSALVDALHICQTMVGFEGFLTPTSPQIVRVEPESPPQSAGTDVAQRPFYAITLRLYERASTEGSDD